MVHKDNSVYFNAASPFTPADTTLPTLPADDEIMAGETGDGAAALWDRLMPGERGLLRADVVIEAE